MADDAIFAAVELVRADLQSPARRDPGSQVPSSAAVATPGGPVKPSTREVEKGPTPGLAVAAATAARGSTGAVVASGAGASFSLPLRPAVPRFGT